MHASNGPTKSLRNSAVLRNSATAELRSCGELRRTAETFSRWGNKKMKKKIAFLIVFM